MPCVVVLSRPLTAQSPSKKVPGGLGFLPASLKVLSVTSRPLMLPGRHSRQTQGGPHVALRGIRWGQGHQLGWAKRRSRDLSMAAVCDGHTLAVRW